MKLSAIHKETDAEDKGKESDSDTVDDRDDLISRIVHNGD